MSHLTQKLTALALFAVLVLFSATWTLAGNLDSPGLPDADASKSYTLQDLYNRLHTGAMGTQSAFTKPDAGPAPTMHNINTIMGIAPAMDNDDGATPADVLKDKTFWGLTEGSWGHQTGTLEGGGSGAGVPKTGQTTYYGDRDDGELQRGVAWPNPRFTDNNNGTVTDNLTNLVWLKNANCAGTTRNWTTALSDITSLNTAGTMNGNLCGDTSNGGSHQTDWRLPNVLELMSLVAWGYSNPALANTAGTAKWSEGQPFTGVQSSSYWSSTTFADNTVYAWFVFMGYGSVSYSFKTSTYPVWPVRAGQ